MLIQSNSNIVDKEITFELRNMFVGYLKEYIYAPMVYWPQMTCADSRVQHFIVIDDLLLPIPKAFSLCRQSLHAN